MATRPVRVAFWNPDGFNLMPPVIPRGAVADTSTEAVGAEGHLGYVGSSFFEIEEGPSRLVAGFRFVTSDGSFDTIGTGEEDPEADLKFTCYRVFDDGEEEQSKFSVSPAVDISSGSWSGTAGARFDRPVLLAPGRYRIDFDATLSEDYEFDPATFPTVNWTIVSLRFEDWYGTAPSGTALVGLHTYTAYNLSTGASGNTDYEWDDDQPPLACDVTTYRMNLLDWCAYVLARGIGGVPNANRRTYLAKHGYIEDPLLLGETGFVVDGTWSDSIHRTNTTNGFESGGGAFTEQQTIKTAILRILWEMGCALDWTGPKARIIFFPPPSWLRTITLDDVARVSDDDPTPDLSVGYTREEDVVNTADARYLRDYSLGKGQRESYQLGLERDEDAEWAKTGRQFNSAWFWYDWVRDETHAGRVTDAWITHFGKPKKVVTFTGFLSLLDLQRGDGISFQLTPSITIGGDPGEADENQGYGEGGYGDGLYGGAVLAPPTTIIGEKFDGLTPGTKFVIESTAVNWDAKRVRITAREIP